MIWRDIPPEFVDLYPIVMVGGRLDGWIDGWERENLESRHTERVEPFVLFEISSRTTLHSSQLKTAPY